MRYLILFLCLFIFSTPASAEENLNFFGWSMLPVLHDGRVKPVDSFARIHLKIFSGKEKINGMDATEWLAESVFAPDKAAEKPIFKTHTQEKHLNYKELSSLVQEKEKTIQQLLQTPEKEWAKDQQELMRLYFNFMLYGQILGSIIETGADNNVVLRIIPYKETFVSPMALTYQNEQPEGSKDYLSQWHRMTIAYATNDAGAWREAVQKALAQTTTIQLSAETLYNHAGLLNLALALYGLALLLVILARQTGNNALDKASFTTLSIGGLLHMVDIALRIYILARPPIGTLYESIIFVALICILGLAFIARKQKNNSPVLMAGLSGILLLVTAKSFMAEDNMGTLVAVLNTNFWLATHVVCITIGYACCLMTSLFAHYYLIANKSDNTVSYIKTLAILSLLFTTVGTILGGLWADQSWGRFWGWDPKENGALLIVLWLIWLLHGRLSNHVNDLAFAAGMAALSIIVVLAWFGVNLLSVGLHSYGFISGVAWGIGIFCAVEIFLIGTLWFFKTRKLST